MGCASTTHASLRKVLPLPPDLVNSYIDKYPPIVVYKLKQKFVSFCESNSIVMISRQFQRMYGSSQNAQLTQNTIRWMFKYFSDNTGSPIKFKDFMAKYAIITKCEPKIFMKILFQVYKQNINAEELSKQEYQNLEINEKQYFKAEAKIEYFPITLQAFIAHLTALSFDVQRYQTQFILTSESDIPFESINKELIDCDFNDLVPGQPYYVLSAAWFSRWAFYYQQINHKFQTDHIKSTKMLVEDKYHSKKRNKRRDSSMIQGKSLSKGYIDQNALIQQPNSIQFADIQGQYIYELKENIKTNIQCKIVNEKLWKLLISLHQPEQTFKRYPIDNQSLEFYPKAIYYSQANEKGEIIHQTQKIMLVSAKEKLKYFTDEREEEYILTKNFNQRNWRLQTSMTKTLAECSLQPRFFVLKTKNQIKFMGQNQRKQINIENITLGDRVYTYFAFQKTSSEAEIISILPQNRFKVHFKGYSYRYQTQISKDELSIVDNDPIILSSKKKSESIIKGINNIGNTCFINSVVQCLVATPILDDYLEHEKFNEDRQPLIYYLAEMAKKLLKNQKVFPQSFKSKIDINMPAFSGYDQHDAQQFLNILLDKLSDQLREKPTIIDSLFVGKIQTKLTCQGCKKQKNNEEKMYILSLPIPEPEFNCFTIIVAPVSSRSMKKVVIRLHKNATIVRVDDSIGKLYRSFRRKGRPRQKLIYFLLSIVWEFEKNANINPISRVPNQKDSIRDVGIVPNISLQAYEKLNKRIYFGLLEDKENLKELDKFRDMKHPTEAYWTICRIGEIKGGKQIIEMLNSQNQIEKLKFEKNAQPSYQKFGSKTTQLSYKKIVLRKMNSALKRLDHFGIEFLVGIPKWASYNDVLDIVSSYIDNLKNKDVSKSKKDLDQGKDFVIRLLDATRMKCIFCGEQNTSNSFKTVESIKKCCNVFQKDLPIQFSAKIKNYWIYIDWVDFSKCNSMFCSYIEIDHLSKRAEQTSAEQKINLDECMKLYQQPENVQMKCDFCKHQFQRLQNIISQMPNILVLHMKQFRYTPQGHLIKLDIHLRWQEFIDSSKYSMNMQGKIYELFAIVRHSGNSQSGHYTCMAKRQHPYENRKVWINFDDDMTDIIKTEQKNIDDAYLLFYKKVDMPTSAFVNFTNLSESLYQK